MTLSEPSRLRRNRKATKWNHWWCRVYRARMRRGLEQCRNRNCSRLADTFGHLIPNSANGRFRLDNITLLCLPCNAQQANQVWPWLRPLIDEPEHEQKMRNAHGWVASYEREVRADGRDAVPVPGDVG